jgi:hypothetical protein
VKSVDHALVERLLEDESLSFREIARRAACSDWTVRSIAKHGSGDGSTYDGTTYDGTTEREPLSIAEWGIVAGFFLLLVGGLVFAAWRMPPPPDDGSFV